MLSGCDFLFSILVDSILGARNTEFPYTCLVSLSLCSISLLYLPTAGSTNTLFPFSASNPVDKTGTDSSQGAKKEDGYCPFRCGKGQAYTQKGQAYTKTILGTGNE